MAFYFGNKLKLDIEGNQYTIDISDKKVIDAVQVIVQKMMEAINENNTTFDEIIDDCKGFMSSTLGDDAFEELFGGRIITLEDVCELVCYILDEIGNFKNTRATQIINKYTPTDKLN